MLISLKKKSREFITFYFELGQTKWEVLRNIKLSRRREGTFTVVNVNLDLCNLIN